MTTDTTENLSFFKQLLRRRVFQIVGVYLGSIFALVEFTGNLVERYHFADYFIDLVLAGMISMIPAVILVTWRHGAPGKDEWTKVEKVGVPVNLVFAASILLLIIPDQKQEVLTITKPSAPSKPVVEMVNATPVTRIQMFFVEQDDVPIEHQWLSYGFTYLISTDLAQSPAMAVQSFYDDIGDNNFWLLKRSGYKNGLNVPLGLAKSVADSSLTEFFTQSKFKMVDNQFQLDLSVRLTTTGKEAATFSATHKDPYELASQAAQFIQKKIKSNTLSQAAINRVPLKDLTTTDDEALKQFISAMNHLLFENDYDKARSVLLNAVAQDKSFALAYFKLADISSRKGDTENTKRYLQKVLSQNYKLTDRTRFRAKAESYRVSNQIEEQKQVYRSWIDLYPSDHVPKNLLANSLLWQGNDIQQAIILFEASLRVNPNQPSLNNKLGDLYYVIGNSVEAIKYYQAFYEHTPNSYLPLVAMGNVERRIGNLDQARDYYRKAAVVSTDMVTPVLTLGDLDLREGNLFGAQSRIEEAKSISQAPRQQSVIYEHRVNHLYNQGKPKAAFNILQDLQQSLKQFEKPLDEMFRGKLVYMHLYVEANQQERALSELAELEPKLEGSIREVLSIGHALLYVSMGDADLAEAHLNKAKSTFRKLRIDHQQHVIDFIQGHIHNIRGDFAKASQQLIQAHKNFYRSVVSPHDDDIIPYITLALIENLRLSKNSDKAFQYAKAYLSEWPMNPFVNYQVALINFERGDIDQAKHHLNNSLFMWQDAEPEFPNYQQALDLKASIEQKSNVTN